MQKVILATHFTCFLTFISQTGFYAAVNRIEFCVPHLGVWETRVDMNGLSEVLVPMMSRVKHSLMLSSAASSVLKKVCLKICGLNFFALGGIPVITVQLKTT